MPDLLNVLPSLDGLDEVTVGAEKLDVVTQPFSNLPVELHSVNAGSLKGSATVGVIELKNARITDLTVKAATTKTLTSLGFPLLVATFARRAREFSVAFRMIALPPLNAFDLAFVNAGFAGASSTSLVGVERSQKRLGLLAPVANTGFDNVHVENPSGKRTPVDA